MLDLFFHYEGAVVNLLDDFKQFVSDAEAGDQYKKWAKDNPGELSRWTNFKKAILAGQRPSPPSMVTPHGRELIDAGVLYLHATGMKLEGE